MKETVKSIIEGATVNVNDKGSWSLFINKKQGFSLFDTRFGDMSVLTLDEIKEVGEMFIALHKELVNQLKFKDGEECYIVTADGRAAAKIFHVNDSGILSRLAFGNVFKTRYEAETNKADILRRYKKLIDERVDSTPSEV